MSQNSRGPLTAPRPSEAVAPEGVSTVDASPVAVQLREILEGHRLSPIQRRIARYLLDHPDEAVFLSSIDIADAVGVSQPSVTRFACAIGFAGFPEFRSKLRASLLLLTRPTAEPAGLNDLQSLVQSEIRNLETLRESLGDPAALGDLAGRLAKSRPLPVVGLRVSAPLAHLFGYLAAKVHPDVRVIDTAGSVLEDQLVRAVQCGAEWVLAFGLPRYPRELRDGLVWARRLGLRVALVTDHSIGGLADVADVILPAPVSSELAFDSQAAPSVLCTALVHAMLDAVPRRDQALLEELEDLAAERQVFLPD